MLCADEDVQNPVIVFETIIGLVVRLAEHGLIHCDFNEFNIMIDDNEKVTMIDFPEMVSVSHLNAQMYIGRDQETMRNAKMQLFFVLFSLCLEHLNPFVSGVCFGLSLLFWLSNDFASTFLRFNLIFEEQQDELDVSEGDDDDAEEFGNGKPCFSSISKAAGSFDEGLAACGFTEKDQETLMSTFKGD
ncbi:hypothetical protein Ancab_010447 [Ancistrocladus abbreviatus]